MMRATIVGEEGRRYPPVDIGKVSRILVGDEVMEQSDRAWFELGTAAVLMMGYKDDPFYFLV